MIRKNAASEIFKITSMKEPSLVAFFFLLCKVGLACTWPFALRPLRIILIDSLLVLKKEREDSTERMDKSLFLNISNDVSKLCRKQKALIVSCSSETECIKKLKRFSIGDWL